MVEVESFFSSPGHQSYRKFTSKNEQQYNHIPTDSKAVQCAWKKLDESAASQETKRTIFSGLQRTIVDPIFIVCST